MAERAILKRCRSNDYGPGIGSSGFPIRSRAGVVWRMDKAIIQVMVYGEAEGAGTRDGGHEEKRLQEQRRCLCSTSLRAASAYAVTGLLKAKTNANASAKGWAVAAGGEKEDIWTLAGRFRGGAKAPVWGHGSLGLPGRTECEMPNWRPGNLAMAEDANAKKRGNAKTSPLGGTE
ncbi:hypothetical protein HJFPF1_03179 [Paramyrothecium foliicola]|nr:hypothetical protein HJFPF1_03179 [Paramyrothecium foliicola]